ncbi:DUF6508 domain-containing protein [Lacrimispora sp. BS-2]|uniref:DUF6508 domain-containing protein n=1 Tax=Lacrimispora sp. BS-2 TaxID=3151850 RepID=A0AAU7PQL8_9FIRM
MAERFVILTKYISQLTKAEYGNWIIDKKNKGTVENPIQMPFVKYSDFVSTFIQDVYRCIDENKDMELNRYGEILEKNGLQWGIESMKDAEVSSLDAQCIMALIIGAVRAERFCDGALLDFFKSGCFEKWLNRLKDIDSRK